MMQPAENPHRHNASGLSLLKIPLQAKLGT
jgi:hypothetical protein